MTRMTPLTEPRLTGDTVLRVDRMLAETYTRSGEWRTGTLADTFRQLAAARPDDLAFREGEHDLSWAQYDEYFGRLAGDLIAAGLARGSRVAVMLPDGPGVHVMFTACEKAGLTVVGIGTRAGEREIEHLLRKCEAIALVTEATHAGRPMAELAMLMCGRDLPIGPI